MADGLALRAAEGEYLSHVGQDYSCAYSMSYINYCSSSSFIKWMALTLDTLRPGNPESLDGCKSSPIHFPFVLACISSQALTKSDPWYMDKE